MIWRLLHDGREVARGSYAQILDTAEAWRVLERIYHRDGTALAPRWIVRGYEMRPVAAAAPTALAAAE